MQDMVEKKFKYKGLPCVILFTPLGYRCGYVGIPKDKKVDSKKIVCHGNITYESKTLFDRKTDQWDGSWIGFDCAHRFDGRDVKAAQKYYADNKFVQKVVENMASKFSYPPKTLEFCMNECRSIVDQLIKEWKK